MIDVNKETNNNIFIDKVKSIISFFGNPKTNAGKILIITAVIIFDLYNLGYLTVSLYPHIKGEPIISVLLKKDYYDRISTDILLVLVTYFLYSCKSPTVKDSTDEIT